MHFGQAGFELSGGHRQYRLQAVGNGLGQAGIGLLMRPKQRKVGGLIRLAKRGEFRVLRLGLGADRRQRIRMLRSC